MGMKLQSYFSVLILFSLCLSASAQTCRSYNGFTNNEVFAACVDHPVLNSFLHWTLIQSNNTLRIAFRRPSTGPNQWIAWAINPQSLNMIGSQALVAYRNSSGIARAYTSNVALPGPTLHVGCQASAYAVGVAGWATGIKLGSDSLAVEYNTHRNIGITLFVFGTHHSIGYSVIVLSIINVFKGLDILNPDGKWKRAYTGIIIFLGAVAVVLEVITWIICIKRKRSNSDKFPHNINGVNGINGNATRGENRV